MTIIEKIFSLPARFNALKDRYRKQEPDLNAVAATGVQVAMVVTQPGFQAIEKEYDQQVQYLLHRIVGEEKDPATGKPVFCIRNWEQFIEERGYVRGFMAKHNLPMELIDAGARAELKLERVGKKEA